MDPQLQALVAIHPNGISAQLEHKLRQLMPGRGIRWCWPVRLDATSTAFFVQLEGYNEDPNPDGFPLTT